MDRLKIIGGNRLSGSVKISGSKNSALPILFSSLLSSKPCRYLNVPNLMDIQTTFKVLEPLGTRSTFTDNTAVLYTPSFTSLEAPYDLVRKMRASVLTLGPLLARSGYAKVSLPGGCAIGARPINYHLMGFEKLGAEIILDSGYVIAKAQKLKGDRIGMPFPSVGATENLMMAAALAKGETLIENAAREPEIVDLARALRSMGAEIEGEGSEVIHIQGKTSLEGANYSIMGDRIEAGTYLSAGLATHGRVLVEGISPEWLQSVLISMEEMGAIIERNDSSIQITAPEVLKPIELRTLPYPGFPTDMQAQLMAVMCLANGTSQITENIFENRFMHVSELLRLGANISVRGNTATIIGGDPLKGAPVMATDLRASASLIIAGLAATGETIINRIYHLDRGYENLEGKLGSLGASVQRI